MNFRDQTLSRRQVMSRAAAAATLSLITLSLQGTAIAQDEARALLDKAAQAMTEVTSFKFLMRNEDGTTMLINMVELEAIEGAVQRPDSFQATASAKVAIVG